MNKNITTPTWVIHGVSSSNGIVYHTHGLNDYGSLELELNLSLEPKKAQQILNLIGLEIANGKKFNHNSYDNTIFNCELYFKEVEGIYSNNEKLLRVILPDSNFKFPWDKDCIEEYKYQI